MKRRGNRTSVLDRLIVVPAALIALAATVVLGPVALVMGWLYRELGGPGARDVDRIDKLLPNGRERYELYRYREIVAQLRRARRQTVRLGLSEGLSRRSDGMFNDTCARAQQLNQLLDTIAREQQRNIRSLRVLVDKVECRIDDWINAMSATFAARASLIVCMATLLCLVQWQPDWLAGAGIVLHRFNVPVDPDLVPLLGAGVCAALVGLVIGCLVKLTRRDTLWADVPAI